MDKETLNYYCNTMLEQLTLGEPRCLPNVLGTTRISFTEEQYEDFKQPTVTFDFKMSRKYKFCKIIYDQGADNYILQFLDKNRQLKKEFNPVYCDELYLTFTEETGLIPTLPRFC